MKIHYHTCDCPQHVNGAPQHRGTHAYLLEASDNFNNFIAWRWTCSCGGAGRWQEQSDNAAYHDWERHVAKSRSQR